MGEIFDFSLQRDNLYKQVADRIQELIVSESLHPGDKLPGERELAERMGVSRTVVREAIRVLSVRGLVKTKSGCGTYVRELNASDVSAPMALFFRLRQSKTLLCDVYEVRRVIEVEAAGLAAERATGDDLDAMQETIDALSGAPQNLEQFVQLDLDFHLALAAAAHNDLLAMLLYPITNLWQEVIHISYQVPDAVQNAIFYHGAILEHLRARDVAGSRQAMLAHIRRSQEMAESVSNR
ncbi:MAG: FadR family transcriptional regulator [Anaerolineae bacterium]|nr:FadR family transcriptional regulator [Anaerolineae bacterium]